MARGGARKGAGRKKGPQTIEKAAARELVRQKVFEHLGPLLDAQISNAQGLSYLVTRDKKTGKFIRVTEAMAKVGKDEEIIEVWEKDPSVQAFTDLMNRAIDKPAEQLQEIKLTGEINIVSRLQAARKRLALRESPAGDE